MKKAINPTHTPDYVCSHVEKVLERDKVAKIVPVAVQLLKRFEFDAIAFRGMSGCLLAAPLAYLTGKTLIMVRKPEQSHTSLIVEGDKAAKTYVIVDDFISSGQTVKIIVQEVTKFSDAKCIGTLTAGNVYRWAKNHARNSDGRYSKAAFELDSL